jgi:hypothetical protein
MIVAFLVSVSGTTETKGSLPLHMAKEAADGINGVVIDGETK